MDKQQKRKWMVRAVSALLALLMVATLVVPLVTTVFAEGLGGTAADGASSGTAASASAQSEDKTGEDLKAEYEAHKAAAEQYEQQAKQYEQQAADAEQAKLYYQQQAQAISAQIETQRLIIAQQEEELAAKQAELADQVVRVQEARDAFEQRLKAMYEISRTSQLSILLGLDSVADMLTYGENLSRIAESDTQLVDNLKQQQTLMEQQAAQIQADLDELNAAKANMETLNQQYTTAMQNAATEAETATQNAEAYQQYSEEEMEAARQAQAEWAAWAASSGTTVEYWDGGQFQWPLPGYYRISSEFGANRVINGVADTHRGMDIPAPAGTPIYAACDGVVSTNNHWSYGISVKLSISPSMSIIYGHMSARYVNDGDVVVRGQKIGAVGSTGNSTGNHLHFELNVNGSPASIRPYLDPAIEAQLYY